MNQSHPPPPHPNDDSRSPAYVGSPDTVSRGQIPNQPLEAALSLLTNTHLGGQSSPIELHELLNHLNLQKYSEVFIKQEVVNAMIITLECHGAVEIVSDVETKYL